MKVKNLNQFICCLTLVSSLIFTGESWLCGGEVDLNNKEVFLLEKDLLKEGEKHPVEVNLEIYEAPQLPIGEHYHDVAQLKNARLSDKLQLTIGVSGRCELDEESVKGKLELGLADDEDFIQVYVNLKINGLKHEQWFYSRFDRPIYIEISKEGENEVVKVVVITVARKGWKQVPEVSEQVDNSKEFIKPLRVKKSDIPVEDLSIKLRYYSNSAFIYDVSEINKMPKIKADPKWENCDEGDQIVDITPRFKGVIGDENKSNLWVYYNFSSRVFISRSDVYLDTSLRHFVFKNCKQIPVQARLSGELILADAKASTKISDLKKLDSKGKIKRLSKFNDLIRLDKRTNITLANEATVALGLNLYEDKEYAYIDIEYEGNKRSFRLTDVIHMDSIIVLHCGLNDGDEAKMKTLLVLKAELLDSEGKVVRLPVDQKFYSETLPRIVKIKTGANADPFGDDSENDLYSGRFSVPADFVELITDPDADGHKYPNLVITPDHPYFTKEDVVLDATELLSKSGIPFKKDQRALFNMSRNELCIFASLMSVEITENLVLGGCRLPRKQYKTHVTFYEVDSREDHSKEWDMTMIALSKPKLIANAGIVSVSGNVGKIKFGESEITMESTMGDDGFNADQRYGIALKYRERRIEKSPVLLVNLDFPFVVELENNGKHSVVMVIEMKNGQNKAQKSRDLRLLEAEGR